MIDITRLFNDFYRSEKAGGLILILAAAVSLALANSSVGSEYSGFWHHEFAGYSIVQWIDDGLMAVFFLLIGLELEREIYRGELSDFRNAFLPVSAAVGGMLVPAALYLLINAGTGWQSGAGVPMATDIAFAVGILSLLGNRVPPSLKVFVTALAVVDDLGAIIIIALFYAGTISAINLIVALAIFGILIVLNRLKVHNLIPYILGGIAMWYFMHGSGIHATITGVMLAFAVPFGDGSERSPSYILQHFLHRPVAFIVLPLFALANTCILITSDMSGGMMQSYSVGIMAGLLIGKPLGIFLFSYAAVSAGIGSLPEGLDWKRITGAGFLGGIGFTMSIFITLLAFDDPVVIDHAKIAILSASLLSGLVGFFILLKTLEG
jgi:NhaA family Na+:H+ antiporter